MILTTGPAVEGRPVREYLDVVSAQAIMGVNIGKDLTAGFRNIIGGRSKSYEGEIAQAVAEVMVELRAGAETMDADAILSIDIDYETVGNNMLMVAASGTAVKLR
ncbi:MAG TPA: YbjQ family protein [Gaiellaceae bacterium]|nr:YbjQ family protein [Gaiellaceae bacterium]